MSFQYQPFPTSNHTLAGIIGADGEPYFFATQLALFLHYKSPSTVIRHWHKTNPKTLVRDVLPNIWLPDIGLSWRKNGVVLSFTEMINFMKVKSRYYNGNERQEFVTAYNELPLDDGGSEHNVWRESWDVSLHTLRRPRFCKSVPGPVQASSGQEVPSMRRWLERFAQSVLRVYNQILKRQCRSFPASSVSLAGDGNPNEGIESTHPPDPILSSSPKTETDPLTESIPTAHETSGGSATPRIAETEEEEDTDVSQVSSGEEWLPEGSTVSSSTSYVTAEEDRTDREPPTVPPPKKCKKRVKRRYPTNSQRGILQCKLPKIYFEMGNRECSLDITVHMNKDIHGS